MKHTLLAACAALFALQSTAAPPAMAATVAQPSELSDLPLEQAAAPRCGVVFAMVEGLQKGGSPSAKKWPDMSAANGQEFFVQVMAKLMDDASLDQETVTALVSREVELLSVDMDNQIDELMPPCLLIKDAMGL
jgi:hypothetical protein